jgi:hypothetical protein
MRPSQAKDPMINRYPYLPVAAFLIVGSTASAQTKAIDARPSGASTRVEGDVYLVMKSGDTKRGTGRTVYLLQGNVSESLARICASYDDLVSHQTDSLNAIRNRLYDSAVAVARVSKAAEDRLRVRIGLTYHDQDSAKSRTQSLTVHAIDDAINSSVIDTTGSGMDAHYVFSVAKPGKYVVFSGWTIGDRLYQWWAPIDVALGQTLKRDLDNSVEVGSPTCWAK